MGVVLESELLSSFVSTSEQTTRSFSITSRGEGALRVTCVWRACDVRTRGGGEVAALRLRLQQLAHGVARRGRRPLQRATVRRRHVPLQHVPARHYTCCWDITFFWRAKFKAKLLFRLIALFGTMPSIDDLVMCDTRYEYWLIYPDKKVL